jgi:hypothetical protein
MNTNMITECSGPEPRFQVTVVRLLAVVCQLCQRQVCEVVDLQAFLPATLEQWHHLILPLSNGVATVMRISLNARGARVQLDEEFPDGAVFVIETFSAVTTSTDEACPGTPDASLGPRRDVVVGWRRSGRWNSLRVRAVSDSVADRGAVSRSPARRAFGRGRAAMVPAAGPSNVLQP